MIEHQSVDLSFCDDMNMIIEAEVDGKQNALIFRLVLIVNKKLAYSTGRIPFFIV